MQSDEVNEKRNMSPEQDGSPHHIKDAKSCDQKNHGDDKEELMNNSTSSEQDAGGSALEVSSIVAAHYNALEEKGLEERKKSRIFYMRNFNNWIKSMLIKEILGKIQSGKQDYSLKVLDMCCGKGGDLLKWRRGNVKHLICADIAAISVEQCKSRYEDMKSRGQGWNSKLFTCEFITADCTRVRLREKFEDVTIKLDLVSCQFSFHYCFESLPQVECMLKNAAECLRTGGYFIGTIPDSSEIIKRLRKCDSKVYENSVVRIELCCEEPFPLFGGKYNFYLADVVDCPEFLVHFPTLEKLAEKVGLKLVKRERFSDFYNRVKNEGKFLLNKMDALETYPPSGGGSLVGPKGEYVHAEIYLQEKEQIPKVGTLSKSEWDVISLYQIFVFEKVKTYWSADGKPEFQV